MTKLLKIFTIAFLLIFGINACSYKPIFLKKDYDFKIEKITYIGDEEINSIISQKLDLIKTGNKNYKKNYYITLNTTKEKIIISKDSEGDPTKFELLITTIYEIKNDQKFDKEKYKAFLIERKRNELLDLYSNSYLSKKRNSTLIEIQQ